MFHILIHQVIFIALNQVLSNASDGKRYIDFYNVVAYPYLAIVDPRTGECMKTYTNITVDSLISDLNDVLSTHPSPESSQVTPDSKDWNNFPTTPPKRNTLVDQIKNVSIYKFYTFLKSLSLVMDSHFVMFLFFLGMWT